MRILVVDPSSIFRQTLQQELTSGGHQVVAVAAAGEALQRLEESAFDAVLVDVAVQLDVPFIPMGGIAPSDGSAFLRKKKYRPGELLEAVNALLSAPAEERFTVLIIDPDAIAREQAADHLRGAGIGVCTAMEAGVDVVLLGIGATMEGRNGLPIIAQTVSTAPDHIESLYAAGATDYLVHPWTERELMGRMAGWLEARKLRSRLRVLESRLNQRVREAVTEIRATNQRLEQGLAEVTALNRASLALNSTQSVSEVVEHVSSLGRQVLNTEECTVYLHDRTQGSLTMASRGSSVQVPLGADADVRLADAGEGLFVTQSIRGSHSHFRQVPPDEVRNHISAPLTIDETVFGVVQAVNKKTVDPFDTHEEQLLETFAAMASVASKNARLLDQTRKLADELRDSLEKERWLAIEKEKLGAYLPRHVVDDISRNRERKLALGGKTVRASILFSDIVGFTRLSEDMPPQRLISFLNEYMTALTQIVEEEQGIVDKFIGDAIMAIFLPGSDTDNHALRAARAGVRMQQRVAGLRQDWQARKPELAAVQTRIGINTGEVVAGNIGSETRMDYTVVGDNVNVASRIESNGMGGEVHVSESTWIDMGGQMSGRRLEAIQVKNRDKPVQIYAVDVPVLPAIFGRAV